jgi:hypothetical protein
VYQARFKRLPVQDDEHFFTVCRYVERNASRARLVPRAKHWRWGSLWRWLQKPQPETRPNGVAHRNRATVGHPGGDRECPWRERPGIRRVPHGRKVCSAVVATLYRPWRRAIGPGRALGEETGENWCHYLWTGWSGLAETGGARATVPLDPLACM